MTYIRIAFDTENLLEQCGETGEDADAWAETHQQDHIGFICQQLQGEKKGNEMRFYQKYSGLQSAPKVLALCQDG